MGLKSLTLALATSLLALKGAFAGDMAISDAERYQDKTRSFGENCRFPTAVCRDFFGPDELRDEIARASISAVEDLLDDNGGVIAEPEQSRSVTIDVGMSPMGVEGKAFSGSVLQEITLGGATTNAVIETPLPAAAPLLLIGLAGIGFAARRKARS